MPLAEARDLGWVTGGVASHILGARHAVSSAITPDDDCSTHAQRTHTLVRRTLRIGS